MKIIKDFISAEQVSELKKLWEKHRADHYVNWQDERGVVDHRYTISCGDTYAKSKLAEDTEIFKTIRPLVNVDFPTYKELWSALQEQTNAHDIHIDDYAAEGPRTNARYTYVIALETVPEFKTFVWKEQAWDNDALKTYVEKWGRLQPYIKKKSNISEVEDLEHTIDRNKNVYMCDYLELDGIFEYHAGSACLFDSTQLHCSSNWTKHPQFKSRQLLQIHVVV